MAPSAGLIDDLAVVCARRGTGRVTYAAECLRDHKNQQRNCRSQNSPHVTHPRLNLANENADIQDNNNIAQIVVTATCIRGNLLQANAMNLALKATNGLVFDVPQANAYGLHLLFFARTPTSPLGLNRVKTCATQ